MTLPGLVAAQNLADVADRERAWDELGVDVSAVITLSQPSLDMDFAANKSLVDNVSGNNLITFSRSTGGSFYGSNGFIQTVGSGVPRFNHDPVTKESLGLLLESQATNLCTYSEEFNNAIWEKNNATISANAITSPAGTVTADKLIATNTSGTHYVRQAFSGLPETRHTISVYAKAAEHSYLAINANVGGYTWISFNLANGTITYTENANATGKIEDAGNGWYRCSWTSVNVSTALDFSFSTSPNPGGFSEFAFVGDNSSGIYLWGAQLEGIVPGSNPTASIATSYIATTSAPVSRAADVAFISGSNFTSWHNQNQGTFLVAGFAREDLGSSYFETVNSSKLSTPNGVSIVPRYLGTSQANLSIALDGDYAGRNLFVNASYPSVIITAGAVQDNNTVLAVNGILSGTITDKTIAKDTDYMRIGTNRDGQGYLNSTISRFSYYPVRLPNTALTTLSNEGLVQSYPYTFTIKGKDILALNGVSNASVRDFVFIKGLTSGAQPRITTAAQNTASGVTRQDFAMPKNAPTTSGAYFFPSGATLSGSSLQINGTNALSIATSPFSGDTATTSISIDQLRPQANWRISEPMASGLLSNAELAIPFETSDFVLFMKTGRN